MIPRPNRLPGQIAAVVAGTILVFGLTLAAAVLWLSRALDLQARQDAGHLVLAALDAIRAEQEAVLLEYAKWDELALAVDTGDGEWLYRNLGTATVTGRMSDLVVLWGGALPQDLGWIDQSPPAGLSRLVRPEILDAADRRLADGVPLGAHAGRTFFLWRGNDLFVAAAARVEYVLDTALAHEEEERIPRLLMARRLTAAEVSRIAGRALLGDLHIEGRPPEGQAHAPLPGPNGEAVAWLAWDPPRTGTEMLRRMLPILLPVTALAAGLGTTGLVLSRRGARRLVEAERRWATAALTDPLTGLPNRAAFTRAMAAPETERAVIFLDVNGFKRINDSIGHAAGDEVIRRVAERLGALADPDCLLARIGGDEFVFVVTGPNAAFRAEWLAHAAERAVAAPLPIGGHRLQVQAAVGFALAAPGLTGAELVRRADLAMYEGKRRGARDPVPFDAVLERAGQDANALECGLRAALAREGELWIAYQPVVAADGQGLARAEALARWTSPELGPVPPDRFIAVAERAGLMIELGRKLLHLVCDDLARHPGLRVSVNVSALQLTTPDFVPDLLDLLRRRGIDASRIQVELTESLLVDDPDLAAARVAELHAAGIRTALDDFGTGFSSIGTLRQMPFDTLKIDRSFVSGLASAPDRLALVNAMILLAHAMGLRVVCEGVETEEERETLCDLGCDLLQGFGIDRPIPIGDFAARWLDATRQAVA